MTWIVMTGWQTGEPTPPDGFGMPERLSVVEGFARHPPPFFRHR